MQIYTVVISDAHGDDISVTGFYTLSSAMRQMQEVFNSILENEPETDLGNILPPELWSARGDDLQATFYIPSLAKGEVHKVSL